MNLATHDANANVASITDGRDGSDNRAMAYDDLDRLVSMAAPSLWGPAAASFVYDPLDNLRLSKVGTRSCTHEYNALNRLTSISGANCLTVSYGNFRVNRNNVRPSRKYKFEWDQVSGAVTYKLVQTYSNCPGHAQTVWDLPENVAQPWELTGAIPPCGPPPVPSQAQFQYTIQACSTTQCSEKSPSLTVTVSQTEARAAGPAYYHTDALGSPVVQTDAAGQEIADSRRRYEPYGKPLSALAPADQGPDYTGHVADVLTEFSYMQQRYYDPLAGRFLSTDPIPASTGSFNRYAYALNNPYRFIDPDGRRACGKDTTCRLENGERGSSSATGYTAHNTRSTGFGRQNAPTKELQRAMESENPADRQKAADTAVATFGIKSKATYDGPYYDKDLRDNGLTNYDGGITVKVGPTAYRSWSFLGYVLSHEIEVHVGQFAVMAALRQDFNNTRAYYLREVEAYRYNLKSQNIRRFGNTPDEVSEMQERLEFYEQAAGLR